MNMFGLFFPVANYVRFKMHGNVNARTQNSAVIDIKVDN